MRLGTYYRKGLLENISIKTNPSDIVLDVGCFDGYWLSTQIAKEKHAIDLDIDPIYPNITYKKGDALHLPYEDSYFDKVFAFDVIEHMDNGMEKRFVEELLRVTKVGGEITLTTPSKYIKVFPSFLTNWVSKKWGHFKCNGYSNEELLTFIGDIKNIRITNLNCGGYLNGYLFLRFLWNINRLITMSLLDLIAKSDAKKEGTLGYTLVRIDKQ